MSISDWEAVVLGILRSQFTLMTGASNVASSETGLLRRTWR
jgi:hypothetical protein